MSLRRFSAAINSILDLRMRFRYDDSGQVFDPFLVDQVEIIDSQTGTVLETIASGSITNLETGVYKVLTSASWNTTPRTIIDRWRIKKTSASSYEYVESTAVINEDAVASETAIVTLAECKTYLNITSGSTDDLLDFLRGKATSFIESGAFLNRVLTETQYKQLYSADGVQKLQLDYYPITEVTVLSESLDYDNKTYEADYSATDYLIHEDVGQIEMLWSYFSTLQRNTYIEYKAGYSAADMPPDLKMVVLDLISKKYFDIKQGRFGITARNIMTENVNFTIEDLTEANRKVLRAYRKPPSKNGVDVTGWSLSA